MVAIKNMEMPSCCYKCFAHDSDFSCCQLGALEDMDKFEKRADNCPLVEIEERKQGEWILHEENSASSSYHCSVCNRLINVLWSEELSDFPYCHCGAEMRGAENE